MCVAMPARVIQRIDGGRALVELDKTVREVNVHLVPDVREGEYVLLNLGVAVQKLSEAEAREVLALWSEISRSMAEQYKERPEGNIHE